MIQCLLVRISFSECSCPSHSVSSKQGRHVSYLKPFFSLRHSHSSSQLYSLPLKTLRAHIFLSSSKCTENRGPISLLFTSERVSYIPLQKRQYSVTVGVEVRTVIKKKVVIGARPEGCEQLLSLSDSSPRNNIKLAIPNILRHPVRLQPRTDRFQVCSTASFPRKKHASRKLRATIMLTWRYTVI